MSETLDVTGDQVAEGQGDQQTLGWRAELPDPLKQHEAFLPYKTKNELWNGHIDTVTKLKETEGKLANSIPKLGENPTEEEVSSFRKAVGIPETPDGYEFVRPDLPEGIEVSKEIESAFRSKFHDLGIPAQAGKELYNYYMNFWLGALKADGEAKMQAVEEGIANLEKEWGSRDSEQYKANMTLMGRAVDKFGGGDLKKYLDDTGLGNHPLFVKTFVQIGKAMSEDTLVTGGGTGGDIKRGPDGRPLFEYPNSPDMSK